MDKEGRDEFHVFHEMTVVKQLSLSHGGDSCYSLTYYCLLRRAETLGREGREGGEGGRGGRGGREGRRSIHVHHSKEGQERDRTNKENETYSE